MVEKKDSSRIPLISDTVQEISDSNLNEIVASGVEPSRDENPAACMSVVVSKCIEQGQSSEFCASKAMKDCF